MAVVDASDPNNPLFLWGAHCNLPGAFQTVPRSELYAWIFIIERAVPLGRLEFVSDSELNVKIAKDIADNDGVVPDDVDNFDLWARFWKRARGRDSLPTARWTNGHVEEKDLQKYAPSWVDIFGNECADTLAGRSAKLAKVTSAQAHLVLSHFRITREIQRRALAILQLVSGEPWQPRPASYSLPRLAGFASGALVPTAHKLLWVGNRVACSDCLQGRSASSAALLKAWLASPCEGFSPEAALVRQSASKPSHLPVGTVQFVGSREVHQTHDLWLYRGLLYCKRCGAYAGTRARLLAQACRRVVSASGSQVLAAIADDVKPRNLRAWPDEVAEA